MGYLKPYRSCAALCAVILFLCTGCGSTNRPMATSMGDMRAERRISGDNLFEYHEIITLDGTNPASRVGQTIYYGKPHLGLPSRLIRSTSGLIFPLWSRRDLNPSTAAIPTTYGATLPSVKGDDGEKISVLDQRKDWSAQKTKEEHFKAIRDDGKSGLNNDTYIEHREYVSPGRQVVAEIAAQIDKIQRMEVRKIGLELKLVKAEAIEDNGTAIAAIQSSIDALNTSIGGEHDILQTKLATAADGGNRHGVLVIRWATNTEQGLSIDAGDIFNGGLDTSEAKSGYLVLGGIRFSSLVLGEDFMRTFGYKLSDHKDNTLVKHLMRKKTVGFTKYMISAQHVAYVSDLQTELNVQFKAELSKNMLKKLGEIDQIKVQYALSTLGSFNNLGHLGDPILTEQPYIFGQASGATFKDRITNANKLSKTDWMPIYSVIAAPKPTLYKKLGNLYTIAD